MLLPDKHLIIFDLETTDPRESMAAGEYPEIVELGAVKVTRDLDIIDKLVFLVQPAHLDRFTSYCAELTGITREQLEQAPLWQDQWEQFAKFTGYRSVRIGSWGSDFDVPILVESYRRLSLGMPHSRAVVDMKSLVYGVAFQTDQVVRRWGLQAVCSHYGLPNKQQHRALPDVLQIVSLLWRMSGKIEGRDEGEEFQIIEL